MGGLHTLVTLNIDRTYGTDGQKNIDHLGQLFRDWIVLHNSLYYSILRTLDGCAVWITSLLGSSHSEATHRYFALTHWTGVQKCARRHDGPVTNHHPTCRSRVFQSSMLYWITKDAQSIFQNWPSHTTRRSTFEKSGHRTTEYPAGPERVYQPLKRSEEMCSEVERWLIVCMLLRRHGLQYFSKGALL